MDDAYGLQTPKARDALQSKWSINYASAQQGEDIYVSRLSIRPFVRPSVSEVFSLVITKEPLIRLI